MVFAPVREGEIIPPEAFQKLKPEEQEQLQQDLDTLQGKLQALLRQIPHWQRELQDRIRKLDREVTDTAIGHLIKELRSSYATSAEVITFLDAVEEDISEHASDLLKIHKERERGPITDGPGDNPLLRRYGINVLVDHDPSGHAPIVFEDNPTFENLVGRIEHVAHMGTLVTDFQLIRAGAFHRANGGYLILEARKLLRQPYAWEGLKRTLQAGHIRIESLGQALGLVSTVSLEPEPVAVELKVVLIGDRLLYYLLCNLDPEFMELFQVAADLR